MGPHMRVQQGQSVEGVCCHLTGVGWRCIRFGTSGVWVEDWTVAVLLAQSLELLFDLAITAIVATPLQMPPRIHSATCPAQGGVSTKSNLACETVLCGACFENGACDQCH